MNKFKLISLGIIVSIVLVAGVFTHQARATYEINPCQEYGWCDEITPTPVDCYEDQCITPTPTISPEVTPTEEITPTPTQVEEIPNAGHGDGLSDNQNDGRGCASHSCNIDVIVPKGAPATGRGVDNQSGKPLQPATAWK